MNAGIERLRDDEPDGPISAAHMQWSARDMPDEPPGPPEPPELPELPVSAPVAATWSAADRIFISYARSDGEPAARTLAADLEAAGRHVWLDRKDLYGGQGWRQQVLDAIDRASHLVVVMTPGAMASEVVTFEFQSARRRGICVFPVKVVADLNFSEMPRWLSDLHWFSPSVEWPAFLAALSAPCRKPLIPSMARNLPSGWVPRTAISNAAKSALLSADLSEPVATVVALLGPGGFGKSTIAAALCRDDDITREFHEGVLWIALGQSPNILAELENLYHALTGRRLTALTESEAKSSVDEVLGQRRCLLVVDDVWRHADLEFLPLPTPAARHACVITTRQFAVAQCANTVIRVNQMTEWEAYEMLTSAHPAASSEESAYLALARRLGEWPLLLNLTRNAIRTRIARGDDPVSAVASIGQAFDRRGLNAFDMADPADRNDAAAVSVSISLGLLDEADIVRWSELAVFPEDTRIPVRTLAQLWDLAADETEDAAGRLADLSLVNLDLRTKTVELQDVMLQVAQRRAADLGILHARLITAWDGPGGIGPDDSYAWRWVTHHLVAAGMTHLLRDALLDAGWVERRLRETNVQTLLADLGWFPDDPAIEQLKSAIEMSAKILATDVTQVTGQLLGRLLDTADPDVRAFIESAQRSARPRLYPITASLSAPASVRAERVRHDGPVDAVAVCDGGRLAVSSSRDGVLQVWDLGSGDLIRTIHHERNETDHPSKVPNAISLVGFPRSRQVASAISDRIFIWNLDTGEMVRMLGPDPDVGRIRWSSIDRAAPLLLTADSRRIVATMGRGEIWIWDLVTDELVRTARVSATALALSADDRYIVSGTSSLQTDAGADREANALDVWDLRTGRPLHLLGGNRCGITALATTINGHVVSAPNSGLYQYSDTSPHIWDISTGRSIGGEFVGHTFTVSAVTATPDGQQLLSGGGSCFQRYSPDYVVRFWDIATGKLIHELDGHTGPVIAIRVTEDGRWAISAGGSCSSSATRPLPANGAPHGHDGSVRVWDLERGLLVATFQGEHAATALAMANSRTVVAGSLDGAVHILRFEP